MFQYTRYTILAITAAVLLSFPSPVSAEQDRQVGSVVALRGEATAVGADRNTRTLSLKSPVFLLDTIKTGRGRIQLMFEDHTLITLGRDAQMRIEEYVYEKGSENSAMTTEVKEGSFRVMGGAITRDAPENFETRTPSANIGIRGSMYAGVVKADRLAVVFQGGKGIFVANAAGKVDISRPGFGTMVTESGQSPKEPEKFDEGQLSNIEQGFETEDGGEVEDTGSDEGGSDTSGQTQGDTAGSGSGDTDGAEDEGGKSDPGDEDNGEAIASEDESTVTGTADIENITDTVNETVTDDTQDTLETETLSDTELKIVSMLSDLGFSGEKSGSIRSSGISIYKGKMDIQEYNGSDTELVSLAVNWENRRFMGKEDPSVHEGAGFAFGEITSTGELVNVRVLGSGDYLSGTSGDVSTITGSETFGHIYGTNQGGIGLALEGYDINVRDQTEEFAWSSTIAGVLDGTLAGPGSGSATLQGFLFGVAEDMDNPDTNRRVFVNSDPAEFQMTVNRDDGTVSGSLTAYEYYGAPFTISGMQIGGGISKSVYLTDNDMAMVLGGSGVVENTSLSTAADLKTYGNFMMTSGDQPMSTYSSWGYWEAAYKEPGTGKDYHIHVPGAMWLAGKPTTQTVVQNKIDNAFTATYTGGAQGIGIDTAGQIFRLTGGTTDLFINFYDLATTPVSGTIDFDQVSLSVNNPGGVTNSGFYADITNAVTGNVTGAFYGPDAESTGGSFAAEMSGGDKYHGVFAGDR